MRKILSASCMCINPSFCYLKSQHRMTNILNKAYWLQVLHFQCTMFATELLTEKEKKKKENLPIKLSVYSFLLYGLFPINVMLWSEKSYKTWAKKVIMH